MSQSITGGTVRIYLSPLRYFQIRAGLPDPSLSSFPRLTYVLKGIYRQSRGQPKIHRLPITVSILRELHNVWSIFPITFNNMMLWAA